MRPIKTDECTFTFHLVGGTEENDLHCIRDAYTETVTSFWEADPDDHLSDESAVLFVWLYGMPELGAAVAWADTLDDAEFLDMTVSRDDDGDGWFAVELGENERKWLKSGGSIALRLNTLRIPPVGMNLDTYRVPNQAATAQGEPQAAADLQPATPDGLPL